MREILSDNCYVSEILNTDHKTLELLNYQIADIIVSPGLSCLLNLFIGLLED
jgi:hypothetical protein